MCGKEFFLSLFDTIRINIRFPTIFLCHLILVLQFYFVPPFEGILEIHISDQLSLR